MADVQNNSQAGGHIYILDEGGNEIATWDNCYLRRPALIPLPQGTSLNHHN